MVNCWHGWLFTSLFEGSVPRRIPSHIMLETELCADCVGLMTNEGNAISMSKPARPCMTLGIFDGQVSVFTARIAMASFQSFSSVSTTKTTLPSLKSWSGRMVRRNFPQLSNRVLEDERIALLIVMKRFYLSGEVLSTGAIEMPEY